MSLAAIRRTVMTAGMATLLVAQLAGAACGQASAPGPAAPASDRPARGDDWRLRERNALPSAAPGEDVTRISGRQQDWKVRERNELPSAVSGATGRARQRFLELNELPGAAAEVTPRKGPR